MSRADRPGLFRRLDSAVVPRLAAIVRGTGRGARRLGGITGPPGRVAGRLARRNPTFAIAVVAVLVATGLILATGGDQHRAVAPAPPNAAQVLPNNQLGPTTGDTVDSYLAAARQRLSELSTSRTGQLTAVVDFTSYLTAPAVASVLAGLPDVHLTQVYAQAAPPAHGAVHPIPLGPTANLGVTLTDLASQESKYLRAYRKAAKKAKADITPETIAFLERNRPVAAEAKVAAAGIGANVGCVFAVIVTGPPAQLTTLAQERTDVRVLDPAPPNVAQSDIQIVPLEPLATDVVQALKFPPTATAS